MSKIIVKSAFGDNSSYMKDGILLRQVVNVIDELDFGDCDNRHAFGEIEEILPPHDLIQQYQEKRASLNADIDRILADIENILGVEA